MTQSNVGHSSINWITCEKKVKSNEKLILDVKNEVDIIKHSLKSILTELKKLNGKTVMDPLQAKRSNMIMVEVRKFPFQCARVYFCGPFAFEKFESGPKL